MRVVTEILLLFYIPQQQDCGGGGGGVEVFAVVTDPEM